MYNSFTIKKFSISLFLVCIMYVASPSAVYAKTIYVIPNGANTGLGESRNKAVTLERGTEILENGDILILGGGIYPKAQLTIANKRNIRVKNFDGELPILDGGWSSTTQHPRWCTNYPNSLSTANSYEGLLQIKNSRDVNVEGLELRNSGGRGLLISNGSTKIHVSNIKIQTIFSHGIAIIDSGTPDQTVAVDHPTAEVITITQSELTNAGLQREFLHKTDPCSQEVYDNWPYNTHAVNSDYVTFSYNYIHDNYGEGPSAFKSRNVLIDSNIVGNNAANLIYVNHSQFTIIRNNIGYESDDYNPRAGDSNGVSGFPFRDEKESDGKTGGNRSSTIEAYNNLFIGSTSGLILSERLNLIDTNIYNNSFINTRESQVVYQAAGEGFVRKNTSVHNNLFWGTSSTSGVNETGVSWFSNAWSRSPAAPLRSTTDIIGSFTLKNPITIRSHRNNIDVTNYVVETGNIPMGINNFDALTLTQNEAGVKGNFWNNEPSNPSPSPSPSPTPDTPTPTPLAPSPTPCTHTPDVILNNQVDIFDYNALVAKFNPSATVTNEPADINCDSRVDIFDYNILVAAFIQA